MTNIPPSPPSFTPTPTTSLNPQDKSQSNKNRKQDKMGEVKIADCGLGQINTTIKTFSSASKT